MFYSKLYKPLFQLKVMPNPNRESVVEISFANYNYAFVYFFQTTKQVCLSLAETENIITVHQIFHGFVSEFSYGIPKVSDRQKFADRLSELKIDMDKNDRLIFLIEKNSKTRTEQIEYLGIYYKYFREYITMLSSFLEMLTKTLMPSTNFETKLLKYFNNQMFLESFTEFKKRLMKELSLFTIDGFRVPVNVFATFYYAYRTFITQDRVIIIEKLINLVFNKLLHPEFLSILSHYPRVMPEEGMYVRKTTSQIYGVLMYCNSLMNDSFSKFGIVPKINEKEFLDTTLI